MTSYAALTDSGLYALYRQESWQALDAAHRLELLRETVVREAARYGHDCRVQITLEDLPPDLAGRESQGKIELNREMIAEGRLSCAVDGQTYTYSLPDANCRALETVLHEYRHVVQEDVVRGRLQADEAARMYFASNDNTTSFVDGRIVSQYLEGRTDYALYYLQPVELDACCTAQDRTAEILQSVQAEYGAEPSMAFYRQRMETEGYQARIAEYNERYQCENAAAEVAVALRNAYANEQAPVDPAMEKAVRAEMLASAQQEERLNQSQAAGMAM